MTQIQSNSASVSVSHRCNHSTLKGGRCRMLVQDPPSGLCDRHLNLLKAKLPVPAPLSDSTDLSPDLILQFSDSKSPTQINEFLHQLVKLLVQGRVSTKRASVLAFLASQLLRSLPAIFKELHPTSSGEEEFRIVFGDLPRPDHDRPVHDPFHPDRVNPDSLIRDLQVRQHT